MFEITRYSADKKAEWNDFISRSKNGTFLFNRNYMDYHSDRFDDHSLMFYIKDRLYAVLPANVKDGTLYSHQGLTYGGLVMDDSVSANDTVELFSEMNSCLKTDGIAKVVYKVMPWIYHNVPAEEDIYAIFRTCNAKLIAREISSTIIMDNKIKWHRDRRYGINKAHNNGVTVSRSNDLAAFWQILTSNLGNKYGVKPVHTLEEMQLLQSRFPDNIVLYVATKDNEVLGGTVLYITSQVIHAQYISASPEGKRLRVIDAIYDAILNHDYSCFHKYFDFGKSTEQNGLYLNESLIYQKEGFGGRGVCYDTYEWTL
jgi:hypothetical protein